jgi:hypothetical protein
MIVKLEGDAEHFIALAGEQTGNDGGINAAGHRDNYARVFGALGDIKRVQHVFLSSGWVQGPAEALALPLLPAPGKTGPTRQFLPGDGAFRPSSARIAQRS